jgi:hypothetical protein
MFGVHEMFGLSDQMLGRSPGERQASDFETIYNLTMFGLLFVGAVTYVVHAFKYWNRSVLWLGAKLLVLVVLWYGLVAYVD